MRCRKAARGQHPELAGYVRSRHLRKAATQNASSGYEGQLTDIFVNSRSRPVADSNDLGCKRQFGAVSAPRE